jgi:hypothetical protein
MANENYMVGSGSRSMFTKIAQRYGMHRRTPRYTAKRLPIAPAPTKNREHSLVSYLLMPRIAELVKWVIAPGAFVFTAWSVGSFRNWHQFIITWLVLEYLVYEARYQWNDIRGFREDTEHPERAARLRLPAGVNAQRNIRASCLVGGLRLALAVCIAAETQLLGPVTLLIGLVFGLAIVYEALRAAPVSFRLSLQPTARSTAIWIMVGLGYAIRSGVGFWLGGLRLASLPAVSGMLYFVAFGIMFVLLAWVLEAAGYCHTDGSGQLFPAAGLTAKPHLAVLLRWTDCKVRTGNSDLPGAAVPVLAKRGKLYAPWNVALWLGAGLGAVVGIRFAAPTPSPAVYGAAAAVSLSGALLLMLVRRFAIRLAVMAVIAAALIGITFPEVHQPRVIVAVIPWVAIGCDYAYFRASSYQDVVSFGPNLISGLRTVVCAPAFLVARMIVGARRGRR